MARIYACCGNACDWRGSIDNMITIACPICGGNKLQWVDGGECHSDNPRAIFESRRTRDREEALKEKSERKRAGFFERVGEKLFFKRGD